MSGDGFDRVTPSYHEGFIHLLDSGHLLPGASHHSEEAELTEIPESIPPELAAALTRKSTAEARIAEAKATEAKLQLANIKASNDYNRILVLSGPIMETDEISNVLMRWGRRDPGKPITIYLNTPGGSVFDGHALGATLKQLRAAGHKVTIYGTGTVLSMGTILLQYADERVLDSECVVMIHSMNGGLSGQLEQMIDTTDMFKKVQERQLDILLERAKISKRKLKSMTARKELFLTADKALEYGFCDRVE